MPKKEEPRAGRSKMTVMVFQLDGSDQTLQEGIRTISGAIQGMVRPARALPLQVGAPIPPGEEAEPVVEEIIEPNGNDTEPVQNGEPRRSASPRPPQILPDLKVSADELNEYCESKKVGSKDTRKYLAIAGFLTNRMSISSVTQDHIYTCYRLMNWNTPTDAGSPLRSLKRKGYFQKADDVGAYTLNHVGENAIRDMGKDSDAT